METTKTEENKTITFDDFVKVDVRVGTIKSAERIPKSAKMLNMVVSFGAEIGDRVILAGIGEHFSPENLIGTKVMAVVNLPPRNMMGIESNGMILAARSASGGLALATCPSDDGARLG